MGPSYSLTDVCGAGGAYMTHLGFYFHSSSSNRMSNLHSPLPIRLALGGVTCEYRDFGVEVERSDGASTFSNAAIHFDLVLTGDMCQDSVSVK